ncbi:hypothetical protein [Candidatus Methylomicrobium oryzae]|jgi:hypothetical protein|uniref:hypothetical protein n=1 Tax=Candidatus Methylomicrobium oryzae TaxID=2802053 RepID=UPI0019220A5C|nr:hypothetical protein [Methylomicrobium sp. RS1]MBL1263628.1 hypothetical protein [Methylomicrobium sp. RS1]
MKSLASFHKAQQIVKNLQGDHWPESLTLAQAAKLHFADDELKRNGLIEHLYDAAKEGGLDFDKLKFGCDRGFLASSGSVINRQIKRYPHLDSGLRKSQVDRENEFLIAHTPSCGWIDFLSRVNSREYTQLSQHACGCDTQCFVHKAFHNGFPYLWSINGIHQDGFKFELAFVGYPMVTAEQYRNFCLAECVPIPENSLISDWLGDSQDSKEQTLTAKFEERDEQNDIGYSGLLNLPAKKDAWFDVIDDMTREFYDEHNHLPNLTQAWGRLSRNPPKGYEITSNKIKGEDVLEMPGVTHLAHSAFTKRWKSYTSVEKKKRQKKT